MATTALVQDANNRALRTALQGLAIDVAVGTALAIGAGFASANGWGDLQWTILAFSVAKSAVQAGVSWMMRRFIPSAVAPPSDPEGGAV